jgi:hypothetical protein
MSPISFVLPVLVVFVLVCVGLILRAFLRVRGEPILVGARGDDLGDVGSPAHELFFSQSVASRTPAQAGSAVPARREAPAVTPLDPEALNTLKGWYAGRECSVCRREIALQHRPDQRPGLVSTASPAEILTWEQIPRGQLKAVLDSHQPVCASCMVAESFRRRFPDRVTDRPDTSARDRAYH